MPAVTISDNLALLKETKEKIREAILAKNGIITETDDFRAYAERIMQLPTFDPNKMVVLDNPIKNINICEAKIEESKLITEKLSPTIESLIEKKAIQNVKILEEVLENTTALISILSSNENFIRNGFKDSDWCKLYEDKPAEITVPSGNFINFQNNVMTSYSTDTYLLYNETNEFGINGCLINYEDDGSEKVMNAYLVEDDYYAETENFEKAGDVIIENRIASNLSTTSYLAKDITCSNTFETKMLFMKIYTNDNISDTQTYLSLRNPSKQTEIHFVYVSNNKLGWWDSENTRFDPCISASKNTWYWFAIKEIGGKLEQYILQDNNYSLETLPEVNSTNWSKNPITLNTSNQTMIDSGMYYIGAHFNPTYRSQYPRGYIDLNAFIIKGDNEIIYQPYIKKTVTKNKVLLIDGEMTDDLLETTDYDRYHFIKQVIVPEHNTYTPSIVDVNVKEENRSGFNGTIYIEGSDRLAYNFTDRNYVAPTTEFTLGDTSFEIMTKIKFTDISSRQKFTGSSTGNDCRVPGLQINNGGIGYQIPNIYGNWQVDNGGVSYKPSFGSFKTNTWYWIKFSCSNDYVYTISASKDGENFDTFVTYQGIKCYPFTQNDFCFGNDLYSSGGSLPSNSFIDLTGCYIKINDEYVWNGAIDNYRLGGSAGIIEDNETKISYTNWSSSNNISVPKIDYTKSFELSLSFYAKTLDNQPIFDNSITSGSDTGIFIGIYQSKLWSSIGSRTGFNIYDNSIMDVSVNKWYTVKLVWDTTKYVFQNLADNGEWETIRTIENSNPIYSASDATLIGYSLRLPSWAFGGYINYSNTYYKQENNIWGVYTNKIIKELQFTKN